jgi:hypothetical protein
MFYPRYIVTFMLWTESNTSQVEVDVVHSDVERGETEGHRHPW